MAHPRALFIYFRSFQTNSTIFTTSILCWDSNPQPSERESLPITTRPGLPPKAHLLHVDIDARFERRFHQIHLAFLPVMHPYFNRARTPLQTSLSTARTFMYHKHRTCIVSNKVLLVPSPKKRLEVCRCIFIRSDIPAMICGY